MTTYEQKIVQYLDEAHATEMALVRVLQSQIAMTPDGRLRTAIEQHLDETRGHAERVAGRVGELKTGGNPLQAWIGLTEAVVGQAVALGKAPLDLVRGLSVAEKVLKNAKDDCATEALEIATYTAIERLARQAGDRETAELAASIIKDERRMLDRLLAEIPKLTDAVAAAEIEGRPSFDVTATGAADTARETAQSAARAVSRTADAAAEATQRTSRPARRASGSSRSASGTRRASRSASGTRGSSGSAGSSRSSGSSGSSGSSARARTGNGASAEELPISGYADLNASEVVERLAPLSQADLAAVKRFERAHDARSTVLERIESLEGREPWDGYDGQDVQEIRAALRDADEATAARVREYERRHKGRAGVLQAAERETAGAAS